MCEQMRVNLLRGLLFVDGSFPTIERREEISLTESFGP